MTAPSTGGWFAAPAAGWAATRQRLVRLVEVCGRSEAWGHDEVVTDLRWWADQVRQGRVPRIPGARTICEHWGWTEHAARKLMSNEAAWQDARFRTPPTRPSHAHRTPGARSKPINTAESPRFRTPAAREPHGSRTPTATRADQHTSQAQAHSPPKPPRAGGPADVVGGGDVQAPPERPGWVVLGPDDVPPPPPDPADDVGFDGPAPGTLAEVVRRVLDAVVDEQPEHEAEVIQTAMGEQPKSLVVKQLRHSLPRAGWSGDLDPVALAREARAWVEHYAGRRAYRPRGPAEPVPAPPVDASRPAGRGRRRRGAGGRR